MIFRFYPRFVGSRFLKELTVPDRFSPFRYLPLTVSDLSMSEENSAFVENGDKPLGRSSTIHLPMLDSPDPTKVRPPDDLADIHEDLDRGDAAAEIVSSAIALDDDESNKPVEEETVRIFFINGLLKVKTLEMTHQGKTESDELAELASFPFLRAHF